MKKPFIFILMIASLPGSAQNKEIIPLWPGKVPGEAKEKQAPVIDAPRNDGVLRYSEITNPAIEIWPAGQNNNKAAFIICPGGGYRILAYDKEGTEIAAWLNKLGFNAFVLQYRIPDKREYRSGKNRHNGIFRRGKPECQDEYDVQ
jgi:acetyl esterase/lipase